MVQGRRVVVVVVVVRAVVYFTVAGTFHIFVFGFEVGEGGKEGPLSCVVKFIFEWKEAKGD